MPLGTSPPPDAPVEIPMEPMGRYKQNGNGTNHTHTSYTSQTLCPSASYTNNLACELGGVAGTESPAGPTKKSLYENNGVAACSQKRALFIATVVFALLFLTSVIIAYTDCTCAGEKPPNFVDEDWNVTKTFVPRATNGQIFPWNNVRLPPYIKPTRYNITIHPNLTTLEVKGQVSIEFHVEKDTHFIVLHSKNLSITDKMIQDRKGHNLRITKMLEYTGAQQIYIEIKDKFRKRNNYTLNIRYTTKLGMDYEGFYVSTYTNENGDTRFLATTHFEPTYARAAFPCFDEPQLKAKFKMSIFRDRFHIALFNMPVVTTEDVGFYMGTGLLRDDFKESVEMSTYLVAFVICDYEHVNTNSDRGFPVTVYTPPTFTSQAFFALNITTHIMDYYADFFMVPYPLPKQDLVIIPDFATGAMENWGLITFRESSLLFDPVETSTAAHQSIAVIIAHELAHQWFGNLVTMKWWNDLWLNEGFASFLEYLGVDNLFPEWKMMEQFIVDKTQPALALDALSSSHPVSVPVHDPNEIEAIFDTISFSKGAAILHMLGKFLQQETLQNGLNDYLNTYRFNNADTKELWNVFSRNTNQSLDVKLIMDTWTQQMGFPLITITREDNEIIATQERFLLTTEGVNSTARSMPKSKHEYKWYVPLTYIADNDTECVYNVWMNMSDVRFEIDPDVKWIKANVNQSGFYRVMYDDAMWAAIINTLRKNHTVFNAADRASLIDDAFTLCRAGLLNATVPLEMSLYLINERDYVPWATAIEHFQSWSRILSESLSYKLFLQYMRKIMTPVTKFVGWNDKGPHLKKLMRSSILSTAVLCEINDTVSQAKTVFQNWMTKNETVPSDLKEVVYTAGIKYGGLAEWQHCWDTYNTTKVASERKLLLKALGAASDPWLLQRYLLETLERDMVKPQDVKIVLAVVSANPEGRLHAWRHLKAYWPTMQSLFGNATFMMGGLISAVTAHLSTPYDYYDVSTYFKGMHVGSASRALEQSLETIKLNINWVTQNQAEIYKWLRNYVNQ
ncbi:endoplasmic reticulum aminopeptidase 1-like isoform X2 [Atheta coriaria]|uniref:endoplasmic reticulum aminopeptidase 1-like isoform X2 n=1 Tax=Dalotia coriaria TaxID=877792 RepID=UPI0031F3751D